MQQTSESTAPGGDADRTAGGTGPWSRPVVVQVPADRNYVVLIRSAVSHLGARLGFTMAEISDLRLAVDEACGLLLLPDGFRLRGDDLECRFEDDGDGGLHVRVSAEAEAGSGPDTEGFGWNVLDALVDRLRWSYDSGRVRIELTKRSAAKGD